MKSNHSLCILVAFFLCLSCSKEKYKTNEALLPLAVGNQWNYENVFYNEDGSVSNQSTGSLTILKDTSINGSTHYSDGYTLYKNTDENTVMSSIDGKDFFIFFKRTNVDKKTIETWSGSIGNCTATDILTLFTDLTNINGYQSLKNEAALKNCNGVRRKTISYLKPGIGITKRLLYHMSSTNDSLYLRFKQELKSYRLK